MARICVFCGSRTGAGPFEVAAKHLGRRLAERGVGLVYGGASIGLMGVVADAALEAGGEVIGVIPPAVLKSEIAHTALSQLHIVRTMHERKQKMTDLADAFIAMPGGLGTFDELFECLTWRMLGIHDRPIGIYDVGEYFTPLRTMIDHAKRAGFVDEAPIEIWTSQADELIDALI
jgi:hypothetical protein